MSYGKVKLLSTEGLFGNWTVGNIYDIVQVDPDDDGMTYRIYNGVDSRMWVENEKVELVKNKGEETMGTQEKPFKVGDKVEFVRNLSYVTMGKEYEVTDIRGDSPEDWLNENICVLDNDGDRKWINKNDIKLTTEPEPEAEPVWSQSITVDSMSEVPEYADVTSVTYRVRLNK